MRRKLVALLILAALATPVVAAGAVQLGSVQRVTAFGSYGSAIAVSDDGRSVLGALSAAPGIYLLDRSTSALEQVDLPGVGAVIGTGHEPNPGYGDAMSADARYVVFETDKAYVPGDTNNLADVFVRDRVLGTTSRASLTSAGSESPALSGGSVNPSISADGRFVVFESASPSFAPLDENNCVEGPAHVVVPCTDIFIRDLILQTTEKISVPLAGSEAHGHSKAARVSGDGRYVAFTSGATDLVPGDTNGLSDVFVRDRTTGTTTRVSVATDGTQADGESCMDPDVSISRDGRYVAFSSTATNLVGVDPNGIGCDIFLRDLASDTTTILTAGSSVATSPPRISGDGHYVLFGYDQQVYLYDRIAMDQTLVSANPAGGPGNSLSFVGAVSNDGGVSLFTSRSSDLVAGDTNNADDVFLREVVTDAQPPSITISAPAAGAAYSLGQVIAATYSCSDELGGSGLASCIGPVASGTSLDTGSAGSKTFQVTAKDIAGNTNALAHAYVVRAGDAVEQVSGGATVSTDPGGVGASPTIPIQTALSLPASAPVTNVSIGTGPAGSNPPGFQLFGRQVTIDTAGQTASTAQPFVVVFTIDKSFLDGPPAITPADVQVFRDGASVAACVGAGASPDPCVASRTVGSGGDAVITVRTIHFSVFAFGRIAYRFAGFFQPVDNLPTVNSVKAGSAIPVNFSLTGYRGMRIFATGYPKSDRIACSSSAHLDSIETTSSAKAGSLEYVARSDRYTYVWKTDKAWANTCRDLVITFADGTVVRADFKFK